VTNTQKTPVFHKKQGFSTISLTQSRFKHYGSKACLILSLRQQKNFLFFESFIYMNRLLLIAITVLLLAPNFFNKDLNRDAYYTPPYDNKEKYNPALGYINSLDKLENYIDNVAEQHHIKKGSLDYVVTVEDAIEQRFYHGFSHLTTRENWMAAVAEKLFGFGLSCKVIPEDIMQHGNAACSQQSMVMMEMLNRKKLPWRKVGFDHHYALEVLVSNNWYYFDPNMEPDISEADRLESNWKCCADNLKKYYDSARFTDLAYKFGVNKQVIIGATNEKQASNAKFFQSSTGALSKTLWLLPLLIMAFSKRRVRNYNYMEAAENNAIDIVNSFIQNRKLKGLRSAG
jgi:hypothetical protein